MYRLMTLAARSATLTALTLSLSAPLQAQTGSSRDVDIPKLPGSCPGGFTVEESFAGNGQPGEIIKLISGEPVPGLAWVVLPDTSVPVASVVQDHSCSFEGDLIVATEGDAPSLWRVKADGTQTRVAQFSAPIEGVATVPNDPVRFGPVAGRILTSAADLVLGIDASGNVVTFGDGADFPLSVVPPVEVSSAADYSCSGVIAESSEPGASVVLTRGDVPEYRQNAVSGADGHYRFSGLCAGTYTVTVLAP